MKRFFAWYHMTHDKAGKKYAWIIGKNQDSNFTIYYTGYSRASFVAAAEKIITTATDPTSFLVINPSEKETVYKLTRVYYSARNSGYMAMEKAFATA